MLRKGPRVLLLVSAFVFALLGNQARVLLLALAGIHGGAGAVTNYHDAAGYVVLAILLAGVAATAWFLFRLGGRYAPVSMGAERGPDPAASPAVKPAVGWALCIVLAGALLAAHAWFLWRGSLAAPPSPPLLAPAETGLIHVDREVPETILGILQPDEYSYIRALVDGEPSRVIGYHFYWEPRRGNANQLYHRPDRCMPGAGWRIDGEVTRENIRLGDRDFAFNVFPMRGPQGPALMLWGSYLNGEPVGIDFNNDVYLGTANLRQFIMTGTRIHSYEVAACILPYPEGQRPASEAIREFAANVFRPTATGSTAN
jgi:exosortase/archaeosortase family protein